MAEYYFISQLPSLEGIGESSPLPITEERFSELCERFLGKRAQEIMKKIQGIWTSGTLLQTIIELN